MATHNGKTYMSTVITAVTPLDSGSQSQRHTSEEDIQWTEGTTARAIEVVWSDTRTLVATSEDIDFSSLPAATKDLRGAGVALTDVRVLIIKNTHATSNLILGGAAAQGWEGAGLPFVAVGDKVTVRPGTTYSLIVQNGTGYAVTAGVTDTLKIDSGAATISYEILVAGKAT